MLTVREGDENPYVWTIEDTLHWHGSPIITWYFSSTDTTEVKKFRTANSFTADGIIESNTWDYLMR
jgi:hypothetical protein